jgi:NADH-quinone oxidoreductase subunit C
MDFNAITALIKERFPEAVLAEHTEDFTPWVEIRKDDLLELALFLRDHETLDFLQLMCLSGAHKQKENKLESVLHLFSPQHRHKYAIKVIVDLEDASCPSVASVWPTADWHERESFDLVGIHYEGHPDLRRILCPDDWDGHPLRKDYKAPATYNGMPLD